VADGDTDDEPVSSLSNTVCSDASLMANFEQGLSMGRSFGKNIFSSFKELSFQIDQSIKSMQ